MTPVPVVAPARFMICCAARTGSTMLVRLLRGHPDLLMHGEVWGERMVGLDGPLADACEHDPGLFGELERERFLDLPRVLGERFFDAHGRQASGFKLKYDELVRPQWQELQRLIAADCGIGIVFLHRDDLLRRYLSHQIVLRQTGITNVPTGEALPLIEPFVIDIDECLADIVEIRRRTRHFDEVFARHRSIHLHYEALARDPQTECERVFAFLGVPAVPVRVATEKIVRDPPETLVVNYPALVIALREAGFAEGH